MRFFPSASLPLATSVRAAATLAGTALPADAEPIVDPLAPRAVSPRGASAPPAVSAPATPEPRAIDADASDDMPEDATDEAGDASPGGLDFVSYHGMSALVPGHVSDLAWELVGPEVAVKAVWAAMVGSLNRDENKSKITFRGDRFALEAGVQYRTVQAPLGDGLLSLVLLHPSVLVGGVTVQEQRSRRRSRSQHGDETQRGERSELLFVYRVADVDPATGTPTGFADALTATLRLPFRREWAPALWRAGHDRRLITPLDAHGTIAAVRVSLGAHFWQEPLGEIARAAYVAAGGDDARTRTPDGERHDAARAA